MNTTAGAPRQSLMIKNFGPMGPRLMERGKIKIGKKGETRNAGKDNEFQMPVKLDHFIVTTLQRGQDKNFVVDAEIHRRLGNEAPIRIPVKLLFDDVELNFQTRYVCYVGKSMWCTGDGESASRQKGQGPERETVTCVCPRQDPTYTGKDKCKPNGVLSVMIDGVDAIGGVWKFRTTSYNSIMAILSSMMLIKSITGGPLAGIPLDLTIQPKTAASPTDGRSVTIYVVGLEYRGQEDALRKIGYDVARNRVEYRLQVEQIEQQARLLLAAPTAAGIGDDDPDDVTEEFYPEAAAEAAGAVLVGPGATPTATPPGQATAAAAPATAAATVQVQDPAQTGQATVDQPKKRRGRPAKGAAGAAAQEPAAGAAPQPAAAVAPAATPPAAAADGPKGDQGTLGIPDFLKRQTSEQAGAGPADAAAAPAAAADDYF